MGLDAQVCEAIDSSRSDGLTATPSRYVRTAVRAFFRNKRNDPRLTVETSGHADDPDSVTTVDGIHYAFVSNSSPWTYFNDRAVHTNPGTSFDAGLGVFAMASTNLFTTLRVSRQLLAAGADPKSRKLFRDDNVAQVRIRATHPIELQMDGDYIGLRDDVVFRSVPDALEVVAPALTE